MSQRKVFPISLNLRNRNVLLIGPATHLDARLERLQGAGAQVRMMELGEFCDSACVDVFLVMLFSAPGKGRNEAHRIAKEKGALVYVHDAPDQSDFSMPAVTARGPLQIAISTNAIAPALSRHLRECFDELLAKSGNDLDAFIQHLANLRQQLPTGQRGGLYDEAKRLQLDASIRILPEDDQ